MLRYTLFAVLLFIAGLAQAGDAGRVVFSTGQVRVAARALVADDLVREGDVIATGADGYVYVKTIDSGFLILRPNSKARIAAYHVDNQDPSKTNVKLELLEGVARNISGQAVKQARQNFRFNTPVAAIGVRGTDFTVQTDQLESRVTVISGGVVVSGFGGACTPEGHGPCEGPASRELFAGQVDQLLQIQKGQSAPKLLRGSAQTPDVSAPPRSDEPVSKSPVASPAPLATSLSTGLAPLAANDVSLDPEKGKGIAQATTSPPPPVAIAPPPVVVAAPPPAPAVIALPAPAPAPIVLAPPPVVVALPVVAPPPAAAPVVEAPPVQVATPPPQVVAPPAPVVVPPPVVVAPPVVVPPPVVVTPPVQVVEVPPPVIVPAVVELPRSPPEVLWGRWEAVAALPPDSDVLATFRNGSYGPAKVLGSYAIARLNNTQLVLPQEGRASFSLVGAEAFIVANGAAPVAAAIQGAALDIDFFTRGFTTSLTVVAPGAQVDVRAQGSVTNKGELFGDLARSNVAVSGFLGDVAAREAAYIFKSIDTPAISAFGATRWSR